jgi:purine-nucleoside phosphorylase
VSHAPLDEVQKSVAWIRRHEKHAPDVALILGSGLGDFADGLPGRRSLPTSEIPHYPTPTVEGHKGALVFASIGNRRLLAFQGRIHFYECNDFSRVLYPVLVAAALGTRTMIVTNAAGGINKHLSPGDLMLIADQIDLTLHRTPALPPEPLRAPAYNRTLIDKAEEVARQSGISVKRGVYAGVKGPSYETAAEVEMIRRLGGDVVGMSTVKEVRCAAERGIRVLGISCITNLATGIGGQKLDHAEVTEVAGRVKRDFAALLTDVIRAL